MKTRNCQRDREGPPIELILENMPVRFYWFIRLVPQTPMENEASLFSTANLERLLQHPLALSVGEITRWQELVTGNPAILDLIRYASGLGKRVDGHTAGAKYENLAMIARAGVESCHESITAEEVLERLRLGFHVMLRESSLRQDLRILLKAIRKTPHAIRPAMLTTDSSTPAFQMDTGMTDHLIAIAIEEGIDPVEAYRMVTINPAVYFGIRGYAHRVEGIASSFTTATEIVAIGKRPEAMAAAVNRVLEMGGGIAAVENGKVAFEMPLPLGGMMSEKPMRDLAEKDRALQGFLFERGFPFHDPLYTFIFLPNDFLPEVRINRRGILNIKTGEVLREARNLM